MSKMIQIRNVSDELHRVLKARAALAGKSLSDLVVEELTITASLPSHEELRERLAMAAPFRMTESSAATIRKDRDAA